MAFSYIILLQVVLLFHYCLYYLLLLCGNCMALPFQMFVFVFYTLFPVFLFLEQIITLICYTSRVSDRTLFLGHGKKYDPTR